MNIGAGTRRASTVGTASRRGSSAGATNTRRPSNAAKLAPLSASAAAGGGGDGGGTGTSTSTDLAEKAEKRRVRTGSIYATGTTKATIVNMSARANSARSRSRSPRVGATRPSTGAKNEKNETDIDGNNANAPLTPLSVDGAREIAAPDSADFDFASTVSTYLSRAVVARMR